MAHLVPLFAAITPMILWPIETFLPYPHIVEELAKALLIFFILGEKKSTQIKLAIIIGAVFALSEGVLYIFNIYLVGDILTLLQRFLFTVPLHVGTTLIILFFARLFKWGIILGFISAAVVHFLFNQIII